VGGIGKRSPDDSQLINADGEFAFVLDWAPQLEDELCSGDYIHSFLKSVLEIRFTFRPLKLHTSFFVIPLYLQAVPVHSANCVRTYTVACRRVLSSAPLGSRPLVALGDETYKLNLTIIITNTTITLGIR
jgi:hypothetical protein